MERDAATAKGEEILFFLSQQGVKQPSDLQRIRPLLYRFLDENQTVKIMNRQGEILLTLQENENQVNEGIQMNQESSFFDLFDWLRGKEEGLDFWNGETHFLSIRRKISLGSVQGVVEIINRMDRYDQFMKQFFLLMLGGTGIASLLSLLGGAWLARKLLTPIRSLSDAMQRIGRGGFHERVPVKEKEVSLTASLEGDRCLISVSDRGIGIATEVLPYIFDRFYRADKACSSAKGGYGLGLAIAKRLVERSGGSIKVNSQLSKGTRIEVAWRFERQKGNHCTSPQEK